MKSKILLKIRWSDRVPVLLKKIKGSRKILVIVADPCIQDKDLIVVEHQRAYLYCKKVHI